MTQQVLRKWGNSPAVRLPASIMEAARFSLDQTVEVRAEGGRVIIEPVSPRVDLESPLAGITEDNGHEAVDFGPAQGREAL